MSNKLTLEEVGKLAGVSRSTVSRVVNNQPGVKNQVREQVLQVIQETGYIPNPAARSLAANRTMMLGLVIPRSVATFFGDPYFSKLTQGIAQACYSHNYMLSLFLFYTKEDEQKLLPHITQNSFVDGLIVQATTDTDPIIPYLLNNSIEFIMLGSLSEMDPRMNFIDVDNNTGGYLATDHLIGLGHQRIAHIAGTLDNRAALDRKAGYEKAFTDQNIPIDPNLIIEGDFTEESGYSCTKQLLKMKPDAIFASSDSMAVGALRAVMEAGLSVPDDLAIVGYDDLPPATSTSPKLTTIHQPIRQFGINAVEMLIDIITNGNNLPHQAVYDTHLVIRQSCGATSNN
jgi:LacI family transcriptional regulator